MAKESKKESAVQEIENEMKEQETSKSSIIVPEPVKSEASEEASAGVSTSEDVEEVQNISDTEEEQDVAYLEETRFEVKPSLWQKIKNSRLIRAISYIMRIRVVLDYPALPEGNLDKWCYFKLA